MKNTEIIEMFEKIIKDSFDWKNKIISIQSHDIFNQITHLIDVFQRDHIYDWIDYMKFKRPGYVVEDLKVILTLGLMEAFGVTVVYDLDALQDWTYKYGVKYISKEQPTSKRNMYLGEALKKMTNELRYGGGDIVATSLYKLKQKYGDEFIKENFPNIWALSKGITSIGEDIEAPETWGEDPLNT